MLTIGLTGGIASGKTTVADLFAEFGVATIDADVAAREVVEPGTSGLQQIVDAFGPEVLDSAGALDRRKLRERVFADEKARERLEAILHPLIRARLLEQLDACRGPYAILIAPLLLETGLDALTDRVLVVDVPEDIQIQRVMQRDGSSEAQARAILAAQVSRTERLARADDVLDNTVSLRALRPQVEALHHRYTALATTQP